MTPFGIKGLIILIVDHCQNSLIAKILIAESPIAKILTAEWAIAKILTAKCPIAKILIAVILIANIQIAKYPIAKILIAQMLSSLCSYLLAMSTFETFSLKEKSLLYKKFLRGFP